MFTKEKAESTANITLSNRIREIPVLNIRMMTDDEWNRLAYRNYLERRVVVNG